MEISPPRRRPPEVSIPRRKAPSTCLRRLHAFLGPRSRCIYRRMCPTSMIGTYFTVYGGIISIEHYRAGETITSPRRVAHGYPGATWPAISNGQAARAGIRAQLCIHIYIDTYINIFVYAYTRILYIKTFIHPSECAPALIYSCSASKLQRHETRTFIL